MLLGIFAHGQIVNNWNTDPYITEEAMVFHDDLDFYLNSYSKQEIKAMRKQVNIWRMNFDKVIRATIDDIRAHSEGSVVAERTRDFTLPDARTGDPYHLLGDQGRIRAFMFLSVTNPPGRFQLPLWNSLQKKYDSTEVHLFAVYGRELHPGDKKTYKNYPSPKSEGEKLAYAQELAMNVDIPVLVDGLNDAVLDGYGRAPNAAYVVDKEGNLVFRGTWADSRKIEYIIDMLLKWEKAGRPSRLQQLDR